MLMLIGAGEGEFAVAPNQVMIECTKKLVSCVDSTISR